MTTLAIIGGGIAGRSLIYALAKEKNPYSKIILFDSPSFAKTCSLNSTAVVAGRGVTMGHSVLGDLLAQSFKTFSEHVKLDRPHGVFLISQWTGAITKLDQFKIRYPNGQLLSQAGPISFKNSFYLSEEVGFLIEPEVYQDWLLKESRKLPLEVHDDFVLSLDGMSLKTQKGLEVKADQIVFAGGIYNRFWKMPSKPVQGSYLEFKQVNLGPDSFSLTLEGDNLIYHSTSQKLLMGSTTQESCTELYPRDELEEIYQRLSDRVNMVLPALNSGLIKVGIREKASKREPYLKHEGKVSYLGGLYKNGYSLSLEVTKDLVSHLLRGPL